MKRNYLLILTLFVLLVGTSKSKAQVYFSNPFSPSYFQPHLGMNFGMIFNHQDFLLDFGLGFEELGYDFSATLQGSFRPFYKKVLMEESSQYFYQIQEKIIQFSLDLEKRFYLLHFRKNSKLGFYVKAKGAYFWGTYKGLSKNRHQQFVLNPGGGIAWHISPIVQLSFGYLHLPQNPHVSPHTLNAKLTLYLTNNSKKNTKFE